MTSKALRHRAVHEEDTESNGSLVNGVERATNPVLLEKHEGVEDGDPRSEEADPPSKQHRNIILQSRAEVGIAVLCHLAVLSFYIYVHSYDWAVYGRNRGKGFAGALRFGGRWKYLTYINFCLQPVYFSLALISDLLPVSSVKLWLKELCDTLFTVFVFPLSLFIAVSFWSIYSIDRELIYPAKLDEYIPTILNHYWHTSIVGGVVLETILVFHRYPPTKKVLLFVFLFSSAYISWVFTILAVDDHWVYPFLRVMPSPAIVVFFSSSYFATLGMYYTGKKLAYYRWKARHEVMDYLKLGLHSVLGE